MQHTCLLEKQGHSMVPIVDFLGGGKKEKPCMNSCEWYLNTLCLQHSSKTYSEYIKKLQKKENLIYQYY